MEQPESEFEQDVKLERLLIGFLRALVREQKGDSQNGRISSQKPQTEPNLESVPAGSREGTSG